MKHVIIYVGFMIFLLRCLPPSASSQLLHDWTIYFVLMKSRVTPDRSICIVLEQCTNRVLSISNHNKADKTIIAKLVDLRLCSFQQISLYFAVEVQDNNFECFIKGEKLIFYTQHYISIVISDLCIFLQLMLSEFRIWIPFCSHHLLLLHSDDIIRM